VCDKDTAGQASSGTRRPDVTDTATGKRWGRQMVKITAFMLCCLSGFWSLIVAADAFDQLSRNKGTLSDPVRTVVYFLLGSIVFVLAYCLVKHDD
jgi:hypothetical protein